MSTLRMTRGDSATFDLAFTDGAGDPIDLTDVALTFTARRSFGWPTPTVLEIVKTDFDGIVVDYDPTSGKATLTIEPIDTETYSDTECLGPFDWDVELRTLAGEVRTPLSGTLAIALDVTTVGS